jgi:dTDP-4-amino-4,6-dideoxygalactose transaminase
LEDVAGIQVLSRADAGSCPLALILECQTEDLRERIRTGLIAAAMYPAVHWPIESRGCEALRSAERLSQRLLTLPCDFRYDSADLMRVVEVVQRLARGAV